MQQHLHNRFIIPSRFRKTIMIISAVFCIGSVKAGSWYVNDASTTGDVFTTAIGNDANPGTAASPFATIQFAITTAVAGDTIYVDAGSYTGDVTISKSSLTLLGVKRDIAAGPMAVPIGRGFDETIVTGTIFFGASKDNITVNGFSVDRGSTDVKGIEARGLNSKVINNILTGVPNIFIIQRGISTRVNGPVRTHSYLISQNNISGFRFGIYFDGQQEDPSEISYNYITNTVDEAILMAGSGGHDIKANVIENNIDGINITLGNNIIEQNTLRNNSGNAIRLSGTPSLSGNSIINNFIDNNGIGINLTDPDPGAMGNEAHYNSFTGNTQSITNTHAATFNAKCNWFESTVQAVIAAKISGPVTFVPFLLSGIDNDPGTDGFQPLPGCSLIPVKLISFTGKVKDADVVLQWQTATEVNSSYFVIERSEVNGQFYPVGRVAAAGYSDTKQNYTFTDDDPAYFDKPILYRLAAVDRDGTKEYSGIITVVIKTKGSYVQKIAPNPVKAGGILQSNIVSAINQQVSIAFINSTGYTLQRTTVLLIKGINKINIPVPATASGIQFLLFRMNDKTEQLPVYIY